MEDRYFEESIKLMEMGYSGLTEYHSNVFSGGKLCYKSPDQFDAFCKALPKSRITRVRFINESLSDDQWAKLLLAMRGSKVEFLSFENSHGCGVGSKALDALGQMLPYVPIRELHLDRMDLGNEVAEKIASNLSRTQIRHLSLAGNNIGSEGAKLLASALSAARPAQFNLCLYDNKIGDEGGAALATSRPWKTVQVRFNPDFGQKDLLDICGNGISASGRERLLASVGKGWQR